VTGHELKRSLSWVKKWLKRFREAGQPMLEMFKSQSRVPHHRPRQIMRAVRDVILDLRDQLREKYSRVVGPKTILLFKRFNQQRFVIGCSRFCKMLLWRQFEWLGITPIMLRDDESL
jgi:hypothetical protein